jgi:rod shape-determining protein MreC
MERASRWLLVLLLLGELALLSRQVTQAGERPPMLEGATVGLLGPLARGVSEAEQGIGGIGDRMRFRRRVMVENDELRQRVDELERELLRLRSLQGEFLRLGNAVEYARRSRQPLRMADVVYADYASWLRSLMLYVGEGGAARNQPVISQRGLVGRVVASGGAYAKVQLITDRTSAVGAMVERTGRQGVARGDGHAALQLDYVPLQADVRPGDRVVTAGIDGIFARGIPLGVVRSVRPGNQLFHRIEVAPLVDFGTLDHVYLLGAQPEPQALSEELSRGLR